MVYNGASISVSNPDWFKEEEVYIDSNGSMICPVCGCCGVVRAVVTPDFDGIFAEIDYWNSGEGERLKRFRLICWSRCGSKQPHR
jgi:hypothetical protein